MISIIIPAHNEAAVIERCLRAMMAGAEPGELEAIVVCNGCTDDTASVARRCGDAVRVIETEIPSKSHALNLGDSVASGFPRFYVDADIVLTMDAIRTTAAVLISGIALAAAPRIEVNLSRCSWPVCAYHKIWLQLPYIREQMLGSGVYAVSELGRACFDRFPDIIADDEFIRRTFRPDQKCSVEGARFLVTPPATIGSLIHIGIRRREGMHEIRGIYPKGYRNEFVRQRTSFARMIWRPFLWPAMLVYCYVKVATVFASSRARRRGKAKEWKRDETSRGPRGVDESPGP